MWGVYDIVPTEQRVVQRQGLDVENIGGKRQLVGKHAAA